jgi:hypothetical protein
MDLSFAIAYNRIVGTKVEQHEALRVLVGDDVHDVGVLLDPRFKTCWANGREYIAYVAELLVAPSVVELSTPPLTITTSIYSLHGVRFAVTVTVAPDGRGQRLVVHGTHDSYDRMLTMSFDPDTRTSNVTGLYPCPMLQLQGVLHSGRFLLQLVDIFNRSFGIHRSRLVDVSEKPMCPGGNAETLVPLEQLFLLAHGNSWYMGHGFFPYDDADIDEKIMHLACVRATSMVIMFGREGTQMIVELSGLQQKEDVSIGNLLVGAFFELLLLELFANNNITCHGIHTILSLTEYSIKRHGYDFTFYDFEKRYDVIETRLPERLRRG